MLHRRNRQKRYAVQAQVIYPVELPASLTIECALALPIFFLACVTLITFMNAVPLQLKTNLELSNRARRTAAVLSYSGSSEVPWVILSQTKTVPMPVSLPGIRPIRIRCYARVHVWDGSPLGSGNEDGSEESEMIFVSEHAEVYHTDPSCTHIALSVFQSTTSEIASLRNANGGKYKPCRGFPKHYSGPVYAAQSGDYYYPSTDYAALTRHVRCISKKEADGLRECSRCRTRDAETALKQAS